MNHTPYVSVVMAWGKYMAFLDNDVCWCGSHRLQEMLTDTTPLVNFSTKLTFKMSKTNIVTVHYCYFNTIF